MYHSAELSPSMTAGSGAPVIVLDDVHLNLASGAGTVNVLRGVSLTLRAGERLGVVGPSGSGKTTLLMAMTGLERVTSGRVTVAGQDLAALDEDGLARLRRDRIGIVFQSFRLIATMTALENVAIPLEFAGRPDAFTIAAQALERVGLAARRGHYPGQLSGGEQQRVALARAMVGEPALVLADEPTGNLDARTGEMVIDLLFGLAQRCGTTLVLVTHDPALAARCDRVIHLKDGRIAREG